FARPDEEKLIGAALGVFQGDLNPHFFLYPTLFIYVMAAAFAVLFAIERVAGVTLSQASFVAKSLADPSMLHLTARLLAAACGTAPLIALLFTGLGVGFLAGTPFALLDWRGFLAEFTIQSRTAFGTHHGSILDAARAVVGERGWSHHLTFTLRYGVGLPLLGAALGGAVWLILEQPQTAALVL